MWLLPMRITLRMAKSRRGWYLLLRLDVTF